MTKKVLILVNAAPYGSERVLSALRIALTLSTHPDKPEVRLFFISDSVVTALPNQQMAEKQTLELMLREIIANGAEVLLCKTCVYARGLQDIQFINGAKLGTLNDLANWTLEADSTLSF